MNEQYMPKNTLKSKKSEYFSGNYWLFSQK